jgi:serine/threonine protein phosphatase PrpC
VLRVADKFADSDTGRHRPVNEDAYFARAPLFAVADGMGGARAGEVASHIAVEVLEGGLPEGEGSVEQRLALLVDEANARIHEVSRSDEQRAGMGTTLTAAYVGDEELVVAHVGDSRLYRLRDGVFERLTHDHSLVEELVRQGRLTPEEADEHPQRSIITRALGPEDRVQTDSHTWRTRDGDLYLVCSDGLTSMVPETRVGEILKTTPSLAQAGRTLIRAANDAGGRDNITVVLFRLEDVEAARGQVDQPTGDSATATALGPVPRRIPQTPLVKASARSRRSRRRLLGALAVLLLVVAPVGIGVYIATQSVYFVGTSSDGFVTLYRGLPYDLPAGIHLYTTNYVSGVSVADVPAARRKKLLDHQLRSHNDATDLVRRLERGQLQK